MKKHRRRLGGLTRREWVIVGQTVMRWPRLDACSPETAQMLLEMVNHTVARFDAGERDEI